MRITLAAAAAALLAFAASSSAASLCNCCGNSMADSCATACAPVKPPQGQCVATVDYQGTLEIAAGLNPLYDIPLRTMWLGTPARADLEVLRRLLETARRGAEMDRKAALKARRRGKIDDVEAGRLAKRYDDAMVNYYLGMQSYRLARAPAN